MNLSSLRKDSERLVRRLARTRFLIASGQAATSAFPSLFRGFEEACSAEAFAFAREETSRVEDEEARRRARALANLASRLFEEKATAVEEGARWALETSGTLRIDGELIAFREAASRLMNESNREQRRRTAAAIDERLERLDAPLARAVERRQEVAERLGFSSYEALAAWTTGIELDGCFREAEATLRETEDAYRDLIQYALRKLSLPASVGPGGEAQAHDVARLARLPTQDDTFKGRQLLTFAPALLEGFGLSPDAGERIEIDAEPRDGKRPGALVFPLAVPSRIAISYSPRGGFPDHRDLLQALGQAQQLSHLPLDSPPEVRLASDPAISYGFGFFFEGFLHDSTFLRRMLGLDARDATEAARMVAIVALHSLRADCARLLHARTLYAEGPEPGLKDEYRDTLRRALLADGTGSGWLWDVAPRFEEAHRLRGRALAQNLRRAALDVADEDHFRNPRLGPFLAALFKRSAELDGDTLAKELGGSLGLSLPAAHLIKVGSI
jgi:hypothetical protein